MRQGQNNSKRSRGRGRKPQSSGNRAYDSNGPDVKIRGTATHVCEKYQQLARDAISAGDRVMAENYYQHAEHYYRLLMASQVVNEGQPRPQHNLGYRPDEDQEEDEEDFAPEQPQPHFPNQPYHQQQPQQYGQRNNQGRGDGQGRGEGSGRGERQHNPNAAQPQPVFNGEEEAPVAASEGEPRGDGYAQGIPGGVSAGPDGARRRQGRRRRPRHEGGNAAGEAREGHQAAEGGEAPIPSGEAPVA
ncbi:DUF4167 domain-containing protein [Parvibaculum sp.]|uniref:DUF4167 domain-containing protein n=1 Tax=Parvibaculum sp. TaxID=2024848 RepID=UPI002C3EAEE0|nr:DUF4167 domain-containing protein [Parvibaculum sp.]HUD51197.1 DUF4167 domain-containing protein [Parvibaculum sp.]